LAAGLGPAAGRVVSWCFLAGVVGGAPVVCLIGASYVTGVTGGGLLARCMVGAALLLVALALTLGGMRASSTAQLVLVTLLIVIIAGTTQLIGLPTTLFLVVYLGCTVSAARTLRGRTRVAAVASALAVLVVLAFCGWPLAVAAAVTGAAVVTRRRARPAAAS